MHNAVEQRRQAFSFWLRTGRLPNRDNRRGVEVKFNPWHDPRDGRFTFAGAGRYFGGVRSADSRQHSAAGQHQDVPKIVYGNDFRLRPVTSMEEADAWRARELAERGNEPGYREAIEARYRFYRDGFARQASSQPTNTTSLSGHSLARGGFHGGGGSFGGGGASGSWGASPAPRARQNIRPSTQDGSVGGGGSSGGGGATGSWEAPALQSKPSASPPLSKPEPPQSHAGGSARAPDIRPTTAASDQRYTFVRNGYLYEVDARGRTRRVSGVLSDTDTPVRSRASQSQAGGEDRRASDDGGHYIAARFNGPADAFNHFAQDANFNRGRYRALEDEWARAKRAGKEVTVTIVPHYHEGSMRPFEIDVTFAINGRKRSIKLPNERTEKPLGKR